MNQTQQIQNVARQEQLGDGKNISLDDIEQYLHNLPKNTYGYQLFRGNNTELIQKVLT